MAVNTLWSLHNRGQWKGDGTRAETRFLLSAKRTSPFKSAGASVHSTTGSRGVHISGSNAGYTMFRGSMRRVLTTHPIRHFPLHFPSRMSPRAITFQMESNFYVRHNTKNIQYTVHVSQMKGWANGTVISAAIISTLTFPFPSPFVRCCLKEYPNIIQGSFSLLIYWQSCNGAESATKMLRLLWLGS